MIVQEPKNKEILSNHLIVRIQNLLPDECEFCEETYALKIDETPLLKCRICNQAAHSECVALKMNRPLDEARDMSEDEILAIINPCKISSLYHICSKCITDSINCTNKRKTVTFAQETEIENTQLGDMPQKAKR